MTSSTDTSSRTGAGGHALAPPDARDEALGRGPVAVAADADALAVVGQHADGHAVEPAPALGQPADERLELAVGRLDVLEVLVVVRAAHVAGLVDGERLHDEQVGVLGLDDLAGLVAQGAVDLVVGHHRGDARDLVAEAVDEVGDADHPRAGHDVEDRLALDPERRHEVRAHAVHRGRRAGEHRREAGDGAGRVDGLAVLVGDALARQAVEERRVGLVQPVERGSRR